jgi:hypothetical protein
VKEEKLPWYNDILTGRDWIGKKHAKDKLTPEELGVRVHQHEHR